MARARERPNVHLHFRITPADRKRIDAVVSRFAGVSTSTVLREAIRRGLDQIEQDGLTISARPA